LARSDNFGCLKMLDIKRPARINKSSHHQEEDIEPILESVSSSWSPAKTKCSGETAKLIHPLSVPEKVQRIFSVGRCRQAEKDESNNLDPKWRQENRIFDELISFFVFFLRELRASRLVDR